MTEHKKLRNVIKGLECCTQHGSMIGRSCNGHWAWTKDHNNMELIGEYRKECPYGECKTGCVKTLSRDVLTLLKEQKRLLHITKAMHTWIFLHTADEDAVYDELGLTDEDNAMLGSIGKVVIYNQEGTVD